MPSIISQITLPNNTPYLLRDSKALRYVGVTTTNLGNGSHTNPITINGESHTAVYGDMVTTSNGGTFFVSEETAELIDNITWTAITAGTVIVDDTYDPTSHNAISGVGVADALSELPEPMIFKGAAALTADSTTTSTCSITITDPQSSADIKAGFTYKITSIANSPKYTGTLKVGDTLIAKKDNPKVNASWVEDTDWVVITSADEPTGTVIGVSVSKKGIKTDQTDSGTITETGTISLSLKNDTLSSLTASSKGSTTGREYAVGLDATGDLSVNVPWKEYTGKNGISIDGTNNTEIGHTNSVTAKTTASLVQLTHDAQGHITSTSAPNVTTVVKDTSATAPGTAIPQGATSMTYFSVSGEVLSLYNINITTDSTIVTTTPQA